jgi:hypothetical protein
MSGPDVLAWQEQVHRLGRQLERDGVYGPESETICRRFQRAHGLVVDGEVGPRTWRVTFETVPHPSPGVPTTNGVAIGLDRMNPPSVAEAAAIKQHAPVRWWGVYVGGPFYRGTWSPPAARSLATLGYQFLPIYVGEQVSRRRPAQLTRERGVAHARDAIMRMQQFGWLPHRDVPVCLDIERGTFDARPGPTLAYAAGWTSTMRGAGYVPGVYSSRECLAALARLPETQRPSWVWLAWWRSPPGTGTIEPQLDPRKAPGFPGAIGPSRRVWQYHGETRHVGGARAAVDISCSTLPLARLPQV